MPKFSGPNAPAPNITSPITSTGARALTYEGGIGYERDAKSELFVLAVQNLVGEDTFYEGAGERDERFTNLIAQVARDDPDWVARFVPWLRNTALLRSAAVVMACEYVKAGGPNGRRVIDQACARADEPAEVLGYWLTRYGRKIPMPVKRGVADACIRLYNERNLLRYDGQSRSMRFADVIELTHPRPLDTRQSELFKHAIERRHKRDVHAEQLRERGLFVLAEDQRLMHVPEAGRRVILREDRDALSRADWGWERLAGWLPGGMDAEAWESVIPEMGYMARLRNLRNFEQAGVRESVLSDVAARLADPDEVARSRQLPLRFLSAWKAAQSMRWGHALEQAINHSLAGVPELVGRTLVLIDISGSMQERQSDRSELRLWETASAFGVALALRNHGRCDTYLYNQNAFHVPLAPNASILRTVEAIGRYVGGGTYTFGTLSSLYAAHDRVVILTDEQAHDAGAYDLSHIPLIYTFNLAGYRPGALPDGAHGRHTFSGLTDAGFRLMSLLETRRDGTWPF